MVSNGLTLAVDRSHTCYAPGDRLSIFVTFKSDNLSPVVLRGFEFSLRETIIYRTGPQSHGKKNGPLVQTSVLGEQKLPVSMTLYGGTQHKAELACVVPGNHTTSSVNAGRHIDIGYSLNIKAIVDLANPVVMDLPVTISNWPRLVRHSYCSKITHSVTDMCPRK
jgi:Arrestin (or S-antigen), C-terminal domain